MNELNDYMNTEKPGASGGITLRLRPDSDLELDDATEYLWAEPTKMRLKSKMKFDYTTNNLCADETIYFNICKIF